MYGSDFADCHTYMTTSISTLVKVALWGRITHFQPRASVHRCGSLCFDTSDPANAGEYSPLTRKRVKMSKTSKILYDIDNLDHICWSPNTFKPRAVLAYKKLLYKTECNLSSSMLLPSGI